MKSMADRSQVTLDEFVSTLRNSSVASVITEGKTDYHVYRRLESTLRIHAADFIPVGGRDVVLKLFERRNEFPQIPVMFIVDRDLWLFNGVPSEYTDESVVITDGYSIENDLYRDGSMESLLVSTEMPIFRGALDELIKWYAFAIEKHLSGNAVPIDVSVYRVIDDQYKFCLNYAGSIGFEHPSSDMYDKIKFDYMKFVRGKTLLDLLTRFVNAQGRHARHNQASLVDHAAAQPGPFLISIRDQIALFLSSSSSNAV